MEDKKDITSAQRKVLNAIIFYNNENGFAPSIRDICKISGYKSTSTVAAHLSSLEHSGYIKRFHSTNRAIKILKEAANEK